MNENSQVEVSIVDIVSILLKRKIELLVILTIGVILTSFFAFYKTPIDQPIKLTFRHKPLDIANFMQLTNLLKGETEKNRFFTTQGISDDNFKLLGKNRDKYFFKISTLDSEQKEKISIFNTEMSYKGTIKNKESFLNDFLEQVINKSTIKLNQINSFNILEEEISDENKKLYDLSYKLQIQKSIIQNRLSALDKLTNSKDIITNYKPKNSSNHIKIKLISTTSSDDSSFELESFSHLSIKDQTFALKSRLIEIEETIKTIKLKISENIKNQKFIKKVYKKTPLEISELNSILDSSTLKQEFKNSVLSKVQSDNVNLINISSQAFLIPSRASQIKVFAIGLSISLLIAAITILFLELPATHQKSA